MILIVDDDKAVRLSVSVLLRRAGYEAASAADPAEALELVRHEPGIQLVLLDMNFSRSTTGDEGLTLLKQIKIFRPDVPVILITAWGSIPLAVSGMQAGAFDFLTKPWDNRVLLQRIATALDLSDKQPAGKSGSEGEEADNGFDRCGIIGRSRGLTDILGIVKRIAPTDASVLVLGENGTGKELIAQAIHSNSRRRNGRFVMVNLGGISQSLFESEMFGHVKGAFTGAVASRTGRFELADKGTIFLDEIGDLDISSQVKLLRVLQSCTFEPLGDSRSRKVDIRVVSATNADLPAMVAARTFREDLFYRINLITLKLPALRERREDIPLLVNHFARQNATNCGLESVPEISSEAMTYLQRLDYPGNIRELKNLVERAMLVSGNRVLTADDFRLCSGMQPAATEPVTTLKPGATLEEIERKAILEAADKYDGNMSLMATALGITRQSLYRRLEKYGIKLK